MSYLEASVFAGRLLQLLERLFAAGLVGVLLKPAVHLRSDSGVEQGYMHTQSVSHLCESSDLMQYPEGHQAITLPDCEKDRVRIP